MFLEAVSQSSSCLGWVKFSGFMCFFFFKNENWLIIFKAMFSCAESNFEKSITLIHGLYAIILRPL